MRGKASFCMNKQFINPYALYLFAMHVCRDAVKRGDERTAKLLRRALPYLAAASSREQCEPQK